MSPVGHQPQEEVESKSEAINGEITKEESKGMPTTVSPSVLDAGRKAWRKAVGLKKTKKVFTGLPPKHESDKADKKALAILFVKKLGISEGFELLSTLQDNPEGAYVERLAFEKWLKGGTHLQKLSQRSLLLRVLP